MFKKNLEVLSSPILFLNIAGGIIGGVWLIILGEWSLFCFGILITISLPWLLTIIMMPGLLLSGIAIYYTERKNFLGYIFNYLSQLFTNLFIVATCVFAFLYCSSYYKSDIGFGIIPYMLWSWSMAFGPWQFFASKEIENEYTLVTLLSAQIFYFLFLLSIFLIPLIGLIILLIFGIVQLFILPIFMMHVANQLDKKSDFSSE